MNRLAARMAPMLLLAAAFALPGRGSAASQREAILRGTVGPGFTITLKTAQGKVVRKLRAGRYTIRIRDLSPIHDFHLLGPGVNKKTLGSEHRQRDLDRQAQGRALSLPLRSAPDDHARQVHRLLTHLHPKRAWRL
jgi:hypothetical protein